jgi:outer membrane protein assembly factor BamB
MLAVAVLAGTAAACSSSSTSTPARSPAVAPPEVASAAPTDWPLPGHDYDNSRQAGPSPIRSTTVSGLAPAWQVDTPGALTTAAVVVDGVAYAEDDEGVVVAVDVATGVLRWKSAPTGFTVGPEGAVLGWGKVFAATKTGVEALDVSTGAVVWSRTLARSATDGVDIQPTVAGGKVLVSTVPLSAGKQFNGGDAGFLYALDPANGAVDWSFDTVDSADLWGNPAVNSGGGSWYPPSVDVATGTVYWGTGNPAPFPGTPAYPNGSSRPGANLYTDSTLALSLATGKLLWYHQETPHDLFDHDFEHTMVVTAGSGSGARQVVVGSGKSGEVVGMDPTTGKVEWSTPVGVHQNDTLTTLPPGTTNVLPGTYGGVLTPPAAAGGTVYVATLNAPTPLQPDQTYYNGGKTGVLPGEVVAIDASDGRIAWDTRVPGDPIGGTTVVNDLVLTGTLQGTLYALDRSTGAIVWSWKAAAGISGWPAVSGSTVVLPTGTIGTSGHLVALRLPSTG